MQERTDTPAAALWCAAYSGNLAIVRRLIAEAVDVNIWDRHGRNALTLAAQAGHLEIARALLAARAWIDPFEDDDEFMSPLMYAARAGRFEMVELLLANGADPTLHGGPARMTAEQYARRDCPQARLLAAILRNAEDGWRRSRSTDAGR